MIGDSFEIYKLNVSSQSALVIISALYELPTPTRSN